MKRRTVWNIVSQNFIADCLLDSALTHNHLLNWISWVKGPDEAEWTVCLVRVFGDLTLCWAILILTQGDRTDFYCFLCKWADRVGAVSDQDPAAWHYWQDSAPDLNCGRTHITNLMPGLPSFPCDLRSNPQRNSHSDRCYTSAVSTDVRLRYGWVFPHVPIYRSGPYYQNNGLPNNIEPSVTLLQKHLDMNVDESRGNRTDVCVQFTNKKATCFNVGCAQRAKVFLQSTNE